ALGRLYDDGLTPSVMDFEETFEAPALPWSGEAGLPTLYLGFAGAEEIVAASWRIARRCLNAAHARALPAREARDYWKTRHAIIYMPDQVVPRGLRAHAALQAP